MRIHPETKLLYVELRFFFTILSRTTGSVLWQFIEDIYWDFYNGPVIVSYPQRRTLTVIYSLLIHDCTTFTSREHVLNENTVRTFLSENCYTLFWRWFCSLQLELARPNYMSRKIETFKRCLEMQKNTSKRYASSNRLCKS